MKYLWYSLSAFYYNLLWFIISNKCSFSYLIFYLQFNILFLINSYAWEKIFFQSVCLNFSFFDNMITVYRTSVPSSSDALSLPHLSHSLFTPLQGDITGLNPHSHTAWLCDLGQITTSLSLHYLTCLLKEGWINTMHVKRMWSR